MRKKSQSKRGEAQQIVAKPGMTPRKVMLSVWWDWNHPLWAAAAQSNDRFYMLLSTTDDIEASNRNRLPSGLRQTTHIFEQKLGKLVWEVLMLPPYSPVLAPLEYHLLRSVQNSLNGIELGSREAYGNYLSQFLPIPYLVNTVSAVFFTSIKLIIVGALPFCHSAASE